MQATAVRYKLQRTCAVLDRIRWECPDPDLAAARLQRIRFGIGEKIRAATPAQLKSADVTEGVIASRIAGHCADIVKKVPGARDWDKKMSKARKALNWGKQIALAIDPEKAREIHRRRKSKSGDVCSMCGEFCAMKISSAALRPTGKHPN